MLLNELQIIPENSPFILSDADVFIANSSKFYSICLNQLEKYDLTGMAESIRDNKTINIGILLCKNTKTIRNFFKFLTEKIETTCGQDQAILNEFIYDWPISISLFPIPEVIQSNMYNIENPTEFSAIQFLCSGKESNENICEKLISACYFLDLTDLLFLLPKSITGQLIDFYSKRYPENPICR